VENEEIKLSNKEIKFLQNNEICRIATSYNDIPHVVPVCYIFWNNCIFFATDYQTKKYKNILKNNRISIIIDVYDKTNGNKALFIHGLGSIIEKGEEFKNIYDIFEKKFIWVKKDPWKENEAPFVKVHIKKKIEWGL
jgi:nitroimidazol reductase NimA-like FMN-containing flavoprotein (pyridoxamine 5'-phosphate oxidase superfamily)